MSVPSGTDPFIARWRTAHSAERANVSLFVTELYDVLGVARPDPAHGGDGPYRFERSVTHRDLAAHETTRRIDLYKRDCFILEAKQGAHASPSPASLGEEGEATRRQLVRNSPGWMRHMLEAKGQAEGYVRDLPAAEAAPPFLIVCDVGFCLDVYADFSGTGRNYAQFPDRAGFRVHLTDLAHDDIRARLTAIWSAPATLDPAKRRAEVTGEIADYLARLARTLEKQATPDVVAIFLMRCLFCMFAQSVGLLPTATIFTELLQECRKDPAKFPPLVGELWQSMNAGGFSTAVSETVRQFNGGLYAHGVTPLAVTVDEIDLLIIAARRDWSNVEPAIFGTLLENALDPRERGRLGAHFTPRAFVERLVVPTVMEPLRADWDGAKAAAHAWMQKGEREKAAAELRAFHAKLCDVGVLDPACGTGNFLYVTMELMKRLEGEVLDALANLIPGEGDRLAIHGGSVDPHQFLGLERNPRAVPVAELVLWIGWLQWHFRTIGAAPPPDPILRDFHNIQEADSLLTYDAEEIVRDAAGTPVTRWDGRTTKKHAVTGEDVPDEAATVEVTRLTGARMTPWPDADFIVGNPPFIGGKDIRADLGEGYATALWATYKEVPNSADLAMFFWWRAAQALIAPKAAARRFGLITSNSIRQIFSRRVVADTMAARRAVRLVFAIADHPWSNGDGAAAVRIAMTVAERVVPNAEIRPAVLATVTSEAAGDVPVVTLVVREGIINADLSMGADSDQGRPLRANEGISSRGMSLHGAGFIVTPAQAAALGLGTVPGLERHIRPYLNGRDLTQRSRGMMVIDVFGIAEPELRALFGHVWQRLHDEVLPQRLALANRTADATQYASSWWIFGKPRQELRRALRGLPRYIATVETAKHRVFCFLDAKILPDNMLVCIATADAFHLGVLSSRTHVAWALAAGGTLEDRPRYNKTRCFDPFPFPDATARRRTTIAALADELDALRRKQLDANPQLTMTGLYNVLDALRAGRPLTPAERDIHDAGLVGVLRDLHDQLDAEVAAAYGWPATLTAPEIVANVVALNVARRAEEAAGFVRWVRPEYQAPAEQVRATQPAMDVEQATDATLPVWPAREPDRYVALRAVLAANPGAPADLSRRFQRAKPKAIATMLETLAALGQARRAADGRWHA